MSTEILINVAPRETRAALLENGVVQELHVERTSKRGLVSNLYKGRVSRVLPGMQAAFIEIGLERTAFLHAADIARTVPEDTLMGALAAELERVEDIRRLLNPGDDVLVQVIKDPMGTKGARLTTFIALPSRYLVYLPRGAAIGVSARIEDEAERTRLKGVLGELAAAAAPGGYIVRTAAQGVTAEGLREDMAYLARLWDHVRARAAQVEPGSVVHEDLPLSLRVLRDELARGVSRVLVDSAREHAAMLAFAAAFVPGAAPLIELYGGAAADLRPERGRGRGEPRARSQSAAQVRRPPGVRPDRVDDHHRRQHRRLRRPSQSRGDHLPHQSRGDA